MPSDDSSVRDALNHQSLQVKPGRPGPRPIIAVLDARPGLAGQLREKIAELAAQVRLEPGCLTFTAYEARDVPGRFYLYEVYASAAAFGEHLQTHSQHDWPGRRMTRWPTTRLAARCSDTQTLAAPTAMRTSSAAGSGTGISSTPERRKASARPRRPSCEFAGLLA